MTKILIGADPEVFVRDKKGRFRSAHGLIPGTKEKPHKVNKGAVQVDGLALEFNIDPASTKEEFLENIGTVMDQMADMVPGYKLEIVPTAHFHGNHLRHQPEEALELGCEPDFNAYTMKENPRPNAATTMRTGAGHVHLGFCEGADISSPEHMQRCFILARYLDVYLGLPSLYWDTDTLRRSMYGKAGCFRPKPYGMEYRTLSNKWLSDPKLIEYVFEQSQRCVNDLMSGTRFSDSQITRARAAINSSNVFNRNRLARELNIYMPPVPAR